MDVILSVDVIKFVLVKVDSVLAIQKQYQVANVIKYVSVMVHIADVIHRVYLHVVVIPKYGLEPVIHLDITVFRYFQYRMEYMYVNVIMDTKHIPRPYNHHLLNVFVREYVI